MTTVLFVGLAVRTAELQMVSSERYVALARDQTVRTQVLAADRGAIYDRSGLELAVSVPLQTIYTDPHFVEDPHEVATALAPLLETDVEVLLERLTAPNSFQYLARHVPEEVAEQVAALELAGVYFLEEPKRFAPAGETASALIGRTDIDNIGLGGLEAQYDEILTGSPGRLTLEQDPAGRTIPVGQHDLEPAIKGHDLVLTIDRPLQYEVERQLLEQVEALGAQGGIAIVSDPRTGEILAMVNVDRDLEEGVARLSANNMALTTVYEPGSVMKAVTWAWGFEHGHVQTDACVPAPDALQIGDKSFTEFRPHGGGCFLPDRAVAVSSNTAAINVALRLGPEALYQGFRSFGLGEPTGLDFPNEQSGVVRPVEEWWSTSIGSMSIGQGISVTPLQMLLVYNTIANGGVHVPPKLVRSTIDPDGVRHLTPVVESRQVISPEAAGIMVEMLRGVVEGGTAEVAAVPGYSVCGKTGTALKPFGNGYVGPDGGRHYIGTFVGFLPCENPQLSLTVVIDDPSTGAYTGGAVAAPLFASLAEFSVRHFDIPPGDPRTEAPAEPVKAPATGEPALEAGSEAAAAGRG